ncbi:hypothetical protein H4R35_003579 [Dimargaris xerosporica]|nr:hypothetical protein H4R35_003579 [Dimargaris xerosporica]
MLDTTTVAQDHALDRLFDKGQLDRDRAQYDSATNAAHHQAQHLKHHAQNLREDAAHRWERVHEQAQAGTEKAQRQGGQWLRSAQEQLEQGMDKAPTAASAAYERMVETARAAQAEAQEHRDHVRHSVWRRLVDFTDHMRTKLTGNDECASLTSAFGSERDPSRQAHPRVFPKYPHQALCTGAKSLQEQVCQDLPEAAPYVAPQTTEAHDDSAEGWSPLGQKTRPWLNWDQMPNNFDSTNPREYFDHMKAFLERRYMEVTGTTMDKLTTPQVPVTGLYGAVLAVYFVILTRRLMQCRRQLAERRALLDNVTAATKAAKSKATRRRRRRSRQSQSTTDDDSDDEASMVEGTTAFEEYYDAVLQSATVLSNLTMLIPIATLLFMFMEINGYAKSLLHTLFLGLITTAVLSNRMAAVPTAADRGAAPAQSPQWPLTSSQALGMSIIGIACLSCIFTSLTGRVWLAAGSN